jgi:hypothetical protein
MRSTRGVILILRGMEEEDARLVGDCSQRGLGHHNGLSRVLGVCGTLPLPLLFLVVVYVDPARPRDVPGGGVAQRGLVQKSCADGLWYWGVHGVVGVRGLEGGDAAGVGAGGARNRRVRLCLGCCFCGWPSRRCTSAMRRIGCRFGRKGWKSVRELGLGQRRSMRVYLRE